MRPALRPAALPAVLSLLLAGCSTSSADARWRSLQRERIARLHQPHDVDDALAAVLANAPNVRAASPTGRGAVPAGSGATVADPAPATPPPAQQPNPQDRPKLDERLPPAPDSGPRQFGRPAPAVVATIAGGYGDVLARVRGTLLDDRSPAWFTRAQVDTRSGAALQAEFWSSDNNLFRGHLINDGEAPAPADARLMGVDVFPHARIDTGIGAVAVPVRVGAFADWQHLEHQASGVTREWLSFGPRVVIEPTWRFWSGTSGDLELFTRVGGDVGAAWFNEAFHNGDGRDSTLRWAGELGAGVRGRLGRVHAELGYRVQHTTYGELNSALYGDRGASELQRQQIFLGFGINY